MVVAFKTITILTVASGSLSVEIQRNFPAESRCVCVRTKPEVRSSLMAARNGVRTNAVRLDELGGGAVE